MKVIALALLVAYASAAPLLYVKEGERQVYAATTKQSYVDSGAGCSEYGSVLPVTVAGDHTEVRLDRPGTYKITYTCTGTETVTKTRTVIVNDFKAALVWVRLGGGLGTAWGHPRDRLGTA